MHTYSLYLKSLALDSVSLLHLQALVLNIDFFQLHFQVNIEKINISFLRDIHYSIDPYVECFLLLWNLALLPSPYKIMKPKLLGP